MTNNDPTCAELLAVVTEAQQARDKLRTERNEVDRRVTQAENALIKAEKAFVDYLVSQQPGIADEVAKRRKGR